MKADSMAISRTGACFTPPVEPRLITPKSPFSANSRAATKRSASRRGHAAGARRRHRLAIGVVHHVARRENTGDRGLGRAGLDHDIAASSSSSAPEQLGRGRMANRHESAIGRLDHAAGDSIDQRHARKRAIGPPRQ